MLKKDITPGIIKETKNIYNTINDITETKDKVNEVLNINLTDYNVKCIINWLYSDIEKSKEKLNEVLSEINDEIEEKKHYEVSEHEEELYYILEHKWLDKIFKIKIELVDQIFKDYSKHWNNLSWEDILRKYKLKPEVWSLIKNKLRLYKASDVISPYTAENLSEEELEEKIHEAIDENISRTKDKMIDTYDKKFKQEAKKAMKIAWNFEVQLDMLQKVIECYKPKKQDFTPETPKNNEEVTILFSDIHIWKKDTHLIKERIHKMTNDIMNRRESIVNIVWLWDYVETIVEWGMHPWQIEHMVWPFWFDLIMEVVALLENMLITLYKYWKKVKLLGISGNHDRLTSDNQWDMEKTWWIIIYELIKRGLQNLDIEINFFREEWNNIELDDFNLIINHWTKNNTGKNPKDILWEYWKQDKHNIIAFWDKHHLEMNDVADNATKVIVPALAWAWEYDKRLVLSSYPWYVIIEKNQDWLPNTLVRRMK